MHWLLCQLLVCGYCIQRVSPVHQLTSPFRQPECLPLQCWLLWQRLPLWLQPLWPLPCQQLLCWWECQSHSCLSHQCGFCTWILPALPVLLPPWLQGSQWHSLHALQCKRVLPQWSPLQLPCQQLWFSWLLLRVILPVQCWFLWHRRHWLHTVPCQLLLPHRQHCVHPLHKWSRHCWPTVYFHRGLHLRPRTGWQKQHPLHKLPGGLVVLDWCLHCLPSQLHFPSQLQLHGQLLLQCWVLHSGHECHWKLHPVPVWELLSVRFLLHQPMCCWVLLPQSHPTDCVFQHQVLSLWVHLHGGLLGWILLQHPHQPSGVCCWQVLPHWIYNRDQLSDLRCQQLPGHSVPSPQLHRYLHLWLQCWILHQWPGHSHHPSSLPHLWCWHLRNCTGSYLLSLCQLWCWYVQCHGCSQLCLDLYSVQGWNLQHCSWPPSPAVVRSLKHLQQLLCLLNKYYPVKHTTKRPPSQRAREGSQV